MEKRIKLEIKPYEINVDGKKIPFLVKDSLATLLFNPALKLNATQVRKNDKIARKLEDCQDDFVLLLPDEMVVIREAIAAFDGFDRNAIELLDRIDRVEEVDVEVKEK